MDDFEITLYIRFKGQGSEEWGGGVFSALYFCLRRFPFCLCSVQFVLSNL